MGEEEPLTVSEVLSMIVAGQATICGALAYLEDIPEKQRERLAQLARLGKTLSDVLSEQKGGLLL